MAIDGDIAVIVTPAYVQIFCLAIMRTGEIQYSEPKTKNFIQHPADVGFAGVTFCPLDTPSCPAQRPPSFHLLLSGIKGLFAYAIPTDLLLRDADLEAFLVWHDSVAERSCDHEQGEQDGDEPHDELLCSFMDESAPQFGADCATVSWIEGPCAVALTDHQPRLIMPPSRIFSQERDPSDDHSGVESYYKISGMDEVALYAMPSRYCDEGLGLIALGNAFGELALYSIVSPKHLPMVFGALNDISIPVWEAQEELLSVSIGYCVRITRST